MVKPSIWTSSKSSTSKTKNLQSLVFAPNQSKVSVGIDKNSILSKYQDSCIKKGFKNQATTIAKGEIPPTPSYPLYYCLIADCKMKPSSSLYYRVRDLCLDNVMIFLVKSYKLYFTNSELVNLKCVNKLWRIFNLPQILVASHFPIKCSWENAPAPQGQFGQVVHFNQLSQIRDNHRQLLCISCRVCISKSQWWPTSSCSVCHGQHERAKLDLTHEQEVHDWMSPCKVLLWTHDWLECWCEHKVDQHDWEHDSWQDIKAQETHHH